MPFQSKTGLPFNKTQVSSLEPHQIGVYGLFLTGTWIYVGKGDIRQRLLAHLNNDIPCILQKGATHFVLEITPNADAKEKELIRELNPDCNQRIG